MVVVLFGLMMLWEYYSMVFVRSAATTYFFPKIVLLYWTLFHVYFYSVPYGYFGLALLPLMCFVFHAMFWCVIVLEVPALRKGAVSIECPREVFNALSWPQFTAALPPDWSVFLPINNRYTPLQDRDDDDESDEEEELEGEELEGEELEGEESNSD